MFEMLVIQAFRLSELQANYDDGLPVADALDATADAYASMLDEHFTYLTLEQHKILSKVTAS